MAHAILYKPTSTVLSSQMPYINISVDGDYVDVEITDNNQQIILSERYYAYGGRVRLYDLGALFESYMREKAWIYTNFTISLINDQLVQDDHTYHILYCDRYTECGDSDKFLLENFLTTLSIRRVAPDDTFQLSMFAKQGESRETLIRYHYRIVGDDTLRTAEFKQLEGNTVQITSVSYIILNIMELNDKAAAIEDIPKELIELVSFTVYCGQRSITAYVDHSMKAMDCFIFRNCFNCWEYASLPCTTKTKTKVERSTAVLTQWSKFYNQRTEKTYEVEMGPLTSDEAEWIDQMFTSYRVSRYVTNCSEDDDPYVSTEILLTDADCETSDSDEKPNTVKFTWRYAENRPHIHLTIPVANFSSPFNINYN